MKTSEQLNSQIGANVGGRMQHAVHLLEQGKLAEAAAELDELTGFVKVAAGLDDYPNGEGQDDADLRAWNEDSPLDRMEDEQLDKYRNAVSNLLLDQYGLRWEDACGDDEPLLDAQQVETPQEFVDRFADKHDMIPLNVFDK